jgi:hypothetical protein
LPFAEAFYAFEFHGDSFQCGDVKSPQAGTAVGARMMMRRDGNAWTATNGAGTLTVRLHGTAATIFGTAVSGTARGFAEDEGVLFDPQFSVPPNGTRIAVADDATLSGSIPAGRVTDFSQGTVTGTVTFSRGGVTSTCPTGAVAWTMNRMQ